jgi:hypothetical protein
VIDADGLGSLQIDGQTLGEAKAAGQRNVWTAQLGDGQTVGLAVYDDSRSLVTGKTLVITRAGDTSNSSQSVTSNEWSVDLFDGGEGDGYLQRVKNAPVLIALYARRKCARSLFSDKYWQIKVIKKFGRHRRGFQVWDRSPTGANL